MVECCGREFIRAHNVLQHLQTMIVKTFFPSVVILRLCSGLKTLLTTPYGKVLLSVAERLRVNSDLFIYKLRIDLILLNFQVG